MIYAAALLILIYAYFIFFCLKGWQKSHNQKEPNPNSLVGISVLVAVRNESANLPKLLAAFEKQLHPAHKFELIIVDDHSTDDSMEILKEWMHRVKFKLHLLSLEGEKGKKAAINRAVQTATFEYMLTTDADCYFGKKWLSSYSNFFYSGAEFVAGPVLMKGGTDFFAEMQKFEFSILSGITAAFFSLQKPIMCNAANMGFSKKLFELAQLSHNTEHIASGDDVFLLHAAKRIFPDRISFGLSANMLVETATQANLSAFIQQRLRWAGKSVYYKDVLSILLGLLIALVNGMLILVLILSILESSFLEILLSLFIAKLFLDYLLVLKIRSFFSLHSTFFYSFLLSLFYPFYSVGIAISSQLIRPKWKGRKV